MLEYDIAIPAHGHGAGLGRENRQADARELRCCGRFPAIGGWTRGPAKNAASERKLHRQLDNSRIQRAGDLAEGGCTEGQVHA